MGVQENAADALRYLYARRKENAGFNDFVEESDLDEETAIEAFEYLGGKGYIDYDSTFGGIVFKDITHEGIDAIEDEQEFKRSFNIGVNLGVFKTEWGIQEE